MSRLIIASNNQGKVKEIKAILGDFYQEILSLRDADIDIEVEEDGDTFHANAAKKAIEISKLVVGDVLADDSGLCVDALKGAPGIYSARYAGANATDEANNRKLLEDMQGKEDRSAKFVCAIVLANDGREKLYVEGEAKGVLLENERGAGSFGYDPLFLDIGYNQTFAELPSEIKNKISHRAKALKQLREEVGKWPV